ncbi:MAG: carboxypeptidase regulatory-like domain-containing protein [Planctomycetes bacterium]|nr:carboxypeptidase regulatory-like domain-containing protein [Planctomycetota bacterium]
MKRTTLALASLALFGALGLLLWWTLDGRADATRALRADPPAAREAAEPSREQHARSSEEVASHANAAAAPSQTLEPLRRHDRAALEIEVVLREAAEPLPAVGIAIRPTDGVDPFLELRRGTSGADGRCRFEDLRPGRWTIALDRGDERELVLAGGALQRERFELTHTGELRGIVIDAERAPVPNAEIWLGRGRNRWYLLEGRAQVVTRSDAEGRFHLRGLPHELHFVGASAAPHVPSDLQRVEIALACAEVEIVLAGRSGALRGRLVDELGAGVSDAQVWCGDRFGWLSSDGLSIDGPAPRLLVSDAIGRFELGDLPLGPARVLARKAGYAPTAESVEIASGETAELILVMKQACALRGRVLDENARPIAGANIEVFGAARFEEQQLASDGEGRLACLDLAPGTVQVQIFAEGYTQWRDLLHARPGEELTLEATLTRALSISGRLVDHGGAALTGWGIATRDEAGALCSAQSQADGAFELAPLRPGEYELCVIAPTSRAILACRELGAVPAGARELVLRVPPDAFDSSLRGRLVDAHGTALEGVWIWCRTLDLWPSEPVRTASDGSFAFHGLAAGTYALESRDARYASLRRTGIEVPPRAAIEVGDLAIPSGGTLELATDDAGSIPPREMPSAEIRALTGERQYENRRFEDGRCTLTLLPGDYEIWVYGQGIVSETARVTIVAGERSSRTIAIRAGVQRQLVFPDPAPAWWHEAPSFRAELSQREGSLRITHEFEADDLWPFSWWPCLVPGTYDLRVESTGYPVLVGSFVLDSARRTPQPIRIATRELR